MSTLISKYTPIIHFIILLELEKYQSALFKFIMAKYNTHIPSFIPARV